MLSATTSTTIPRLQPFTVGQEICHAAIDSVSPSQLVGGAVRVEERGGGGGAVMCVGEKEYPLDQ